MRSREPSTAPAHASDEDELTARLHHDEEVTARRPRRDPRRDPLDAPLVLERYRLHRRLGAGAFGTVWMARDERLERDVAVKILPRERILGGRFEREARAAARLAHPGIVTLYEAAVDDEGAYLVSELVRGSTLDDLLAAGQLSDRDIIAIAIVLCDALQHAHEQGVVHRDVKPSNVLVPDTPPSRSQVAKLTDFGVARVIDSDSLTLTGDVLGTLAYMAPEQAEGLEAGAPADLYSLALVTYEALTGINPVRISTGAQRARRLGAHLPPLRRQRRDLPAGLGDAIDLALAPRPRDRGAITDLREALAAVRPRMDDEPGVVTSAWVRQPAANDGDAAEPFAPRDREPARDREPPRDRDAQTDPADGNEPSIVWPARALAAITAGGFAAWLSAELLAAPGEPAPLPRALVALIAAAAVLALPRLGWAAVVIALTACAALRHHPGGAVALAVVALLPVLVLPTRPTSWPLPTAAVALGFIGLAGTWPAVASRARGTLTRAALGALGWIWLLLAGELAGRALYLPQLPGAPSSTSWPSHLDQATGPLVHAIVQTGVLLPAGVWAVAAAVAPGVVRGRHAALDVIRTVVWAVLTASATTAVIVAVHGTDRVGGAPSAVGGAVASGLVLLAPLAAGRWSAAVRGPGSPRFKTRLP